MGLQGLWVLALAAAHTQGASIPQCCKKKSVGGVEYTLVDETDTVSFGCKSNCVFERVGNPGSRFCFKEGDLEVVCEDTEDGAGGTILNYVDSIEFQDLKEKLEQNSIILIDVRNSAELTEDG